MAVFGLTADYPGAQRRHYRFLVEALPEVAGEMQARGVPLVVRIGRPDAVVLAVSREAGAALVVGDENPLRVGQEWRTRLSEALTIPFVCVDSDVVVPTSLFPKEEYAARTIRPKIGRVIASYLKPSTNPSARARCAVWDNAVCTTVISSRRGRSSRPSAYLSARVPEMVRTISAVVLPSTTPVRMALRISTMRLSGTAAAQPLSRRPWNGRANAAA